MKPKTKITKEDYIKGNRKASREIELENRTGFVTVHKTHKSLKTYSRKNFKVEVE
jgi:hypothetical protein